MSQLARLLLIVLVLAAGPAWAATVTTRIDGVDGEMLANVRASLSLVRAQDFDDVSSLRLRQMADDARDEIRQALRPFGYYSPQVRVRLERPDQSNSPWQANISIRPGEPVTINNLEIVIAGDGEKDPELARWQADWPLQPGNRLDHRRWEEALSDLERLAEERGYFQARYSQRGVRVDPDRQSADIEVVYDTGQRYVFGGYRYDDNTFGRRLMDRLSILEPDEPYSLKRLDRQREVLAGTGLFKQVVVEPEHDDERHEVSLDYRLEPRLPNTWRTTLGFGTDTGARLQLGWTRHYLSSRGNSLDIGAGVQQRRNEYVIQADYLHPRGSDPGDFLTAGTRLKSEQDRFRFHDEDRIEPVFDAFRGRRNQAEVSFGRLQERYVFGPENRPLEEHLFVSVLHESFDAFREGSFSDENLALLEHNPALAPFLDTDNRVLAVGGDWRLPWIRGTGFDTHGIVLRARLLGAHKSLGSDVTFGQAWAGGRWHFRFGERHKFLLSGEAGYTQADTHRVTVELDGQSLDLNLTVLPERYRFKTGGDRTVRGYGFEELSTNRNGANHLLQASAEYEFRVGENWSLAAFGDIGNAFNDTGRRKLKRGVGVGFRWYTMIGPIQLDFARALDQFDKPWRLHFTIGTRLL